MTAGSGALPQDPLALAQHRAQTHGLSLMAEGDWPATLDIPQGLSRTFLRRALMLPLGVGVDGRWRIALADPSDTASLAALRVALGQDLALMVASQPALLSRLEGLGANTPCPAPILPKKTPRIPRLTRPSSPFWTRCCPKRSRRAPLICILSPALQRWRYAKGSMACCALWPWCLLPRAVLWWRG